MKRRMSLMPSIPTVAYAIVMALMAPAHAQPGPADPAPAVPDDATEGEAAPGPEAGGMAGERTLVDDLDEDRPLEVGAQLRIFRQARRRKAEIERMDAMLARRARRIEAIQAEIESRYKTLRLLQEEVAVATAAESAIPREEIAAREEAAEAERGNKVRKLSKVVDKMKPADAAKMLSVMNEPLVVDVMLLVKSKQAARILGEMDPEQAARIGEQMARIKEQRRRGR